MTLDIIKPTSCSIDLTEGCNLACEYCFTHSIHKPRKIDPKLAKRILDWWLPQTDDNPDKNVNIQFWGGEPLLEWKLIKELVKYGEELNKDLKRNIEWGGTTNGLLLTPDKVEWGLKHNCLFMVSLDGVKEVHDKYRKLSNGGGSFDLIVKNFKAAQKLFPRLKARAAISTFSVPYFFESIQFFVEELGLTEVMFSPVFEDDWNEEILEKMEEQFQLVIDYSVKRAKEGKPFTMKHILDEANKNCEPTDPGNPCGAGIHYCGFSVDGFIFPCHRFNKHGLSTEERSKLPTIIGRPKGDSFEWCNQEWRDEFINFKDRHSEKCTSCDILKTSVCNGGCPAVNWDMTKALHDQPKSECDYNKLQHKAGIEYRKKMEAAGLPIGDMRRREPGCFCYNMCYTEGPAQEFEVKRKFLDLSKRILQTHDQEKTEEQRKLELEVLEKTIEIL